MRRSPLAVVGHVGPVVEGNILSAPHALAALAALGQPTRLEIFRLLMRYEPEGLPAGGIAECLGSPHNTISAFSREPDWSGAGVQVRQSSTART